MIKAPFLGASARALTKLSLRGKQAVVYILLNYSSFSTPLTPMTSLTSRGQHLWVRHSPQAETEKAQQQKRSNMNYDFSSMK